MCVYGCMYRHNGVCLSTLGFFFVVVSAGNEEGVLGFLKCSISAIYQFVGQMSIVECAFVQIV